MMLSMLTGNEVACTCLYMYSAAVDVSLPMFPGDHKLKYGKLLYGAMYRTVYVLNYASTYCKSCIETIHTTIAV